MERSEVMQIFEEKLRDLNLNNLFDMFTHEHNPLRGEHKKFVQWDDIQDKPDFSPGSFNVPWLDIRDYGGVVDGVADDTGAINSAIADLPVTGGVIDLPNVGIIKIDGTIILDDKEYVYIRGNGVTIRYTGTGNAIILQNECRFCLLENFWIKPAVDGGNFQNFTALKIDSTGTSNNKCRFKNIFIDSADYGIHIASSTKGTYFMVFEGMYVYNSKSYGLYATGINNANYFHFSLIQEASATATGIYLEGASNKFLLDNVSDLSDGVRISGDHNEIWLSYTESIVTNGGQSYDNVSGLNSLHSGFLPDGVKITAGAIKHYAPYSSRLGHEYLHPKDKGLVGEWSFAKGSGTVIYDFSGTRVNGALTNTPTWVAGPHGYALQFASASTEYATIADNAVWDTTADFSIFIVYKLDNITGAWGAIFSKDPGGSGERLLLYREATGSAVRLQVYNGTNNVFDEKLEIFDSYAGNQWGGFVALTITYDVSETEWKVYQGGVLIDTIDAGTEDCSGGNITLGRTSSGNPLSVTIAKFAWYNRLLTQQEALELSEDFWSLSGSREYYGTAAPTSGTWTRGKAFWRSNATANQQPGWVCTTAGTPGTWKAMANLAA